MAKKTVARHRAACRPSTPLTQLNTPENRRKAAAVAVTGLGAAFVMTSNAVAQNGTAPATQAVDVAQLANETKAALSANPAVTAAEDAQWATQEKVAEADVKVTQPVYEADGTVADVVENPAAAAAAAAGEDFVYSAPAGGASGSAVVDIAMRYRGVPYRWGGATPAAFDCSGFTQYVYRQVGINLPHSSRGQAAIGTRIPASAAQPGDFMFWGSGHAAIYVGDGMMIDSSTPGTTVQVRGIWGSPSFYRF